MPPPKEACSITTISDTSDCDGRNRHSSMYFSSRYLY
jgi:hypothetical protein